MAATRNSIFRDKAIKHYTQGRKKDILPNFSSIPVAIFAWVLFGSLIATCLVGYFGQVPVYLPGSGIVLSSGNSSASALAVFKPEQLAQLHPGQTVKVQLGASSTELTGTIAQVLPGVTTLAGALQHYGLNVGGAPLASQQVAVALIKLGAGVPAALYAGSAANVQVSVGTESLFSALTGI